MQSIQIGSVTIGEVWVWLLAVCTALVTIAKAWEIIKKFSGGDMKKKIADNDKKIVKAETEIAELKDEIMGLKSAIHVILQAELALTNHAIDGNNIQGLKDIRTKMSDFLIKRG